MRTDHFTAWNVVLVAVVVVALIFVLSVVSDDEDETEWNPAGLRAASTLKFLVVISRHGNRGGITDYENDPYPLDNPNYWPYDSSELTPQGRVQMYNLGARVRSLYDGFLNSTFDPGELHASSTYMNRLLMSGEGFLAGLYPPKGWQVWNTNIPWQPTPIYSDSPDNTPLIQDCPRLVGELLAGVSRYFNDSGNKEFFRDLLARYNAATGELLDNPLQLFIVWDKLVSEEMEGYALPAWTEHLYPDPLVKLASDFYLIAFAGTDEIIRLLIGNVHGEMSKALSMVADGTMSSRRRIHYYSGHDSSIIALQVLLGVPLSSMVRVVKPGSALVLELHEDPTTNNHSVQLLYIDGGSKDLAVTPHPLPITGCGYPCSLQVLLHNTAKYTNVNFTEECIVNSTNFQSTDDINRQITYFISKYIK